MIEKTWFQKATTFPSSLRTRVMRKTRVKTQVNKTL